MDRLIVLLHYMIMVPPLVFLHCNHDPRCTATVDKHFDYNTLQLKDAGEVELWYDDQVQILSGPWFWPALPGPLIRFHRAADCAFWDHRYVAFTGAGVAQLDDPGGVLRTPLAVPPGRVGGLLRIMDDLIASAAVHDELARKKATVILQRLLFEAAEIRESGDPAATSWTLPVIAALADGHGGVDYRALALNCGMALPTLRRRFLAATGTPIHEFQIRLRIAEARRLLAETAVPIKEIADRLGYRDVFFFSRQFTRKVGVSPGVFRTSVQRNANRNERGNPSAGGNRNAGRSGDGSDCGDGSAAEAQPTVD